MAFTQQQHDQLEAAIAQGALEVRYGDKKVVYQSLDNMLRVLKLMKLDLGLISPDAGKRLVQGSKGIYPGCSDDTRWIY